MKKIIALSGRPGTGKTTLFREFISKYSWKIVEPIKLLPCLYSNEIDTYIIGKYDDGEIFAGTDKLSMSVQPTAEKFFKETSSNILFEGDRLTNNKFFNFLSELSDTELSIVILSTSESVLLERYKCRGSEQSSTFLKGRETKISNIMMNFDLMDNISEFKNENYEDQKKILAFIESKLL
jgi:broad-specificity NMP kinase